VMLFSWLLPYRVLIVWVYDRTQSLLVVMLMHMPIVVGALVLTSQAISGEQMFVSLIANGAGYWLVLGAVALANRRHVMQDQGLRAAPEGMAA